MNKSIVCILLLSACAVGVFGKFDPSTLSDEAKELMDSLRSTCVKSTEVDEELVKKASDGDISEDSKFKCYTKCVLTESAMMNEKGELDFAPMESLVPEKHKEVFKTALEECGKLPIDDDLCERGWHVVKCLQSKVTDDFYLP